MSRCWLALVVVTSVSLVAGHAPSQNRKGKLQWERFDGEGTVAGYQSGALLMTLADERWIGAVVPASTVKISGFANRNVLRPGVVVRLSAEFDRKTLAATESVTELEIVSPRPGDRAGIFPDEVIDPTERKKGPPPPTARLRIFDAITGVKENTLFFKKYRVEVAPDATITVDLVDPSLLSQGDAIKKVKGRRIKGTQGRLLIEELEAELAQPLAAKTRAPSRGAKREVASKTAPNGDVFGIAGEEASGKKSRSSEKTKKGVKQKIGESQTPSPDEVQPDEKDAKEATPKK
jgi:hypothetical protein